MSQSMQMSLLDVSNSCLKLHNGLYATCRISTCFGAFWSGVGRNIGIAGFQCLVETLEIKMFSKQNKICSLCRETKFYELKYKYLGYLRLEVVASHVMNN